MPCSRTPGMRAPRAGSSSAPRSSSAPITSSTSRPSPYAASPLRRRALILRWRRDWRRSAGGGPTARLLLDLLSEAGSAAAEAARPIAAAVSAATGRAPNIDWALGVLARHLRIAPGAALGLFALGRSIGWIAHIQEQYASGRLIRPRARYVGPARAQDPKPAGVEPHSPA